MITSSASDARSARNSAPVENRGAASWSGGRNRRRRIDISIVIPFHDEQDCAGQVLEECLAALDALPGKCGEIIAIDDGSADRTHSILDSAARNDSRIRVLTFRRNRGQAPALYYGLKMAAGEILATLDGDGQNNPADIPALIARLQASDADLVSGVRVDRHDSLLRKLMSRLANRVRGAFLDDDVTDSGCALKVFRRPVVDSLIPIRTLYSFIPALAKAAGNRIVECPVDHRERAGGKTHYGLSVFLWRPALDMLGVWWFSRRRFAEVALTKTGCGNAVPDPEGDTREASQNRPRAALLTIGIAALFLTQLGSYGLLEPDEGRYAEIAREMASPASSWLIPTLDGIPHFQKPPMIYWFTASFLKVFGVNEIAARLPSALSAVATLLLAMGIARKLFRDRNAIRYTLVILASSPLFLFLGRTLTPDMHMTFWITASLFCLVHSRRDDSPDHENGRPGPWGWLFFVCIGLGFLTKGPVAFLVPLSAAIGYAISLRRTGHARLRIPWLPGLPLALLIGLSWFLVVSLQNPDLAGYFLNHELLDRFGSGAHGRSKPFWFFIPVLLAGFLPWTLIALRLIPAALRNRAPELGLFLGWIAVPFLVLSLSGSKLPTYILPLFPGLAIALGAGIAAGSRQRQFLNWPLRIATAACLAVVALVPVVVSIFILDPPAGLSLGTILFAMIALAGTGLWLFRWSGDQGRAIVPLGVVMLLACIALPSQVNSWNNLLEQQASVKPLADRILAESEKLSEPPRVIACEIRAHGLEFYLGRNVEITRKEAELVLPETASLPVIHPLPKDVARLKPDMPDDPIYVVTRSRRFHSDFAEQGWTALQTAGDFVLLRR